MKKTITRSILIISALGIAAAGSIIEKDFSCSHAVINLAAIFSLTGCSGSNAGADQNAQQEADTPLKEISGTASGVITFLELGSDSCMPCRAMQPVLASVTKNYKGKVNVVFYDVWTDAGAPFAQKYSIEAIPTQIFLDAQGKEFFRHTGFFPEENIERILASKGIKK